MGQFVKGDVVVVLFPFSDLSNAKKRPALVVAGLSGNDVILCQITSQAASDSYAIPLAPTDFSQGQLNQNSYIRPNRLFTADARIIRYRAGVANPDKTRQVVDKIVEIISA